MYYALLLLRIFKIDNSVHDRTSTTLHGKSEVCSTHKKVPAAQPTMAL